MAYSDFTYMEAKRRFGLSVDDEVDLFRHVVPVAPSDWLRETLRRTLPLAIAVSTEKARSEWIIAPLLTEIHERTGGAVSVFSGTEFTVDAADGLNGYCDYVLTNSSEQLAITAPVLFIAEAKNENMKSGLGQCLAAMVAAQRFNVRQEGWPGPIFGAVTSGTAWRFLRLIETTVQIERVEHYIENVERILGILMTIVTIVNSDASVAGEAA